MANTNYPSSLDTEQNLVTTRLPRDTIPASDHNDLAAAIIALQTKLGISGSLPTAAGQTLKAIGAGVTKWVDPETTNGLSPLGSSISVARNITQNGHGFQFGNVLTLVDNVFTLARADNTDRADVVGIVSAVINSNNFTLTTEGYVSGFVGLTPGATYFLSASSYGVCTKTEPTTPGLISKPLFIADTATSGYFHNYRGIVVGSATGNSGGSGSSGGGSNILSVRPVTGNTIMSNSDDVLYVTVAGILITLQDSTLAPTKRYTISNVSNGAITIQARSGQTVDKISQFTLYKDLGVELVPYQTNWILT